MTSPTQTKPEPPRLADHPVLDMLNTVYMHEGKLHDFWQADTDVVDWLVRAGWLAGSDESDRGDQALLMAARDLRDIVQALVEQRKAGDRLSLEALNSYLAEAESYPQLALGEGREPSLIRVRPRCSARQLLAPLAEAAAEMLVDDDFSRIHTCANPECILWFYDRTKSRRRRWCSASTCGNRHKVAAYRKRHQS
ncbi:MAG TPA: ABATE domain-containing protein [Modicisalibacter sp.]|nr:ABATE domain-containing protein [Modicisalibacter sp.]